MNEKRNFLQICGQATLTNKANDALERAKFDFLELVYPKTWETKSCIIFLAPIMTEIGMVSTIG